MDPVVTGISIIEQGGSRPISGGSHTQSIVQGRGNIIRSDIITHFLTNSGELTLESDYFTFDPLKAETLMVVPFNEPFLASDGDVRSTCLIGASRPDQSRIVAPGMNKPLAPLPLAPCPLPLAPCPLPLAPCPLPRAPCPLPLAP